MRLIANRTNQFSVLEDTDRVIGGISLPSGTTLNGINGHVELFGQTDLTSQQIVGYGVEGYIIPVIDPDTAATFQTLFDNFVPKDTDTQVMDLDTAGTNTTPFWEPGEADWTDIFELGVKPIRIFRRLRYMTPASAPSWNTIDTATPFGKEWRARDSFDITIKKRYRNRNPAIVCFALASPLMDDTQNTDESTLLEDEWGQVKYMGETLQRAQLHLLGLTESGAETPFEEATALLQKHMDPNAIEEDAGSFVGMTWLGLARYKFDHSVKGMLGTPTLSSRM